MGRENMIKRFEDLTFTDDFMFCKVMQNEGLCKRLIEMILSDTIGKITYISVQHNINTYEQARQEYRLMSTFEMDAIEKGIYRKAIETAKLMKNRGYPISEILLMTGLPESEIEKL